jgi:hypothetical protein
MNAIKEFFARLKLKITSYLVGNWREVMRHAWSVWAAAAGIITPELIQVLADNVALMPWFDEGDKNMIRMICLFLVVVLRPIDQKKVEDA